MHSPRLHLAIDNCFAYRRWTSPAQWLDVIEKLGVYCVEASADTECDPLYMGLDYMAEWTAEVLKAQESSRARTVNMYSGHGSYTTLGLTHTHPSARRHMIDGWFKPFIDAAVKVGAGVGFNAHAFPDFCLQSAGLYDQYWEIMLQGLCELAVYAQGSGCKTLGLEQMYSPHMPPWTIESTERLMRQVYARCGAPLYFTEDTGHHHVKFMRPGDGMIREWFEKKQRRGVYFGPEKALALYLRALDDGALTGALLDDINAAMDECPFLFSRAEDGDCYKWLERLGAYSPIIHLQQTDGFSSAHKPFTPESNARGVVRPEKVLQALAKCYASPEPEGMPPRCSDIYLTLEIFTPTASINMDTLDDIAQSVAYWRKALPRDGMTLCEATLC